MERKQLLSSRELDVILHRLACQLIENHLDFSDTVIIGIQPRGVLLAQRLVKMLEEEYGAKGIQYGTLDITFFRDDFRRGEKPLTANTTDIPFLVEDKKSSLHRRCALYRAQYPCSTYSLTILWAPQQSGALGTDRSTLSRDLPIQPDYIGKAVDAINKERVVVYWKEQDNEDAVYLIEKV